MNKNDFKFNAIMSSCKYLLPCGRCEMTRKKCTVDSTMVYTIQKREDFKNDGRYNFCHGCGAKMEGEHE